MLVYWCDEGFLGGGQCVPCCITGGGGTGAVVVTPRHADGTGDMTAEVYHVVVLEHLDGLVVEEVMTVEVRITSRTSLLDVCCHVGEGGMVCHALRDALVQCGRDESGMGTYYVLYSYPWGYADNHPNEFTDLNSFDISWAVDKQGNHVDLPGADFIRVYTGVRQYCGWLGETSTEVSRAQDLHIEIKSSVPDDPISDE